MVCVSIFLALVFISGAAFFKYRLAEAVFGPDWQFTHAFLQFIIIKLWMVPFTVIMFFLMFYLVPNTAVHWKDVIVTAVFTALMWEVTRYVFSFAVPFLGFDDIYGGFKLTVTLMTFAYVSGIILVLGANLTVRRVLAGQLEDITHTDATSKEG
jgi:YihY family inner membrane protein